MTLTILLVVVFFVCVAMMWNEGMWSNALTVINLTFSAMIATNYFEVVADFADGWQPTYTYLWDFLSFWGLFCATHALLRFVTDKISQHRVRFKMPVEHTGRVLFAAWAGWIMICLVCTSLHTAPLARTAFKGGFEEEPKSNCFLGFAPDRMWLGFMQSRSEGALVDFQPRPFDPQSEFILKYGARRNRLENNMRRSGSILVRSR